MSHAGLYESDSEPEGMGAHDSDDESLVDVDSPTDGYFERREHPRTPFLPNPATQERSEEDKAREAAAERRQPPAGPVQERERPPSHHSQPRSPVWAADERTPLLDAGPAGPPPDYAAATADRRGHGRGGSHGSPSGSAFSSDHPLVRNGLLGESGILAERSQPQSMRDTSASPGAGQGTGLRDGGTDNEGGHEGGDAERGYVRRQWDRDWNGRRRWTSVFRTKRWLAWLAVAAALLLILLLSGVLEDAKDNGGYPSGGNGRNKPDEAPAAPGHGHADDPSKDNPAIPPHQRTSKCLYQSFTTPEKFRFPTPRQFSFLELIEGPTERSFFNDQISGTVQITHGEETQENDIEVWVSIAVSGPWNVTALRKVHDVQSFELLFPEVTGELGGSVGRPGEHRWIGNDGSCMDISIGIVVRPGTELQELDVSTANLDVHVEHGVFDRVGNGEQEEGVGPALEDVSSTTITTVRGKVDAKYIDSRTTRIETTSSSISGTYALRDVLSVKSRSGTIGVRVDPQDVSDSDPKPADFQASSNSGSINVRYLTDSFGGGAVPERDYQTRVGTHSSSISGSYIFSSSASFSSNSGSLDLTVLPYFADTKGSLRTDSGSAQTNLRLLSPYTTSPAGSHRDSRDGILDHLRSSHKSHSGSLHLTYPDEWEGFIDGESVSGSIRVRGEDVELLVDHDFGKGIPGQKDRSVLRHVTARKGHGDSKLQFETLSGSVGVLVGHV